MSLIAIRRPASDRWRSGGGITITTARTILPGHHKPEKKNRYPENKMPRGGPNPHGAF